MKERPILFSGPMVRAILDGRKTQTRRVVKGVDDTYVGVEDGKVWQMDECGDTHDVPCPFGVPGDRLWVRETWCAARRGFLYRAECADEKPSDNTDDWNAPAVDRWRPSIHMPRVACRTVLEVVSVRVERLQEISDLDLLAEGWPAAAEVARGCEGPEAFPFQGVTRGDLLRGGVENPDTAVEWFADEWDSMYGKGAWEKNPWVWVVEFKRAEVAR